jgi:acyl-CoA reductase-like NAD-dependent aldehyde dehydrogenase
MSSSPSTLVVDNPYTGETACEVPLADARAASAVVDRAQAAARGWRTSALADRIALCERAVAAMEAKAESIAADITRMMGKPLGQARGEVKTTAARARHMMSIAPQALADVKVPLDGFERRIVRAPLGVVLDLPAWNYPLLTAVNCVVPAVLAGNAVIVKHSPRSPLCGDHFARAFAEAGAPADLVQALNCDHAQSERLVGDSRVDQVVFTGSIFGGHRMVEAAARRFMHPTLELGGNDPAYVAADANLTNAVENVVDGACYNAGQSCCAVERVYVHKSVYGRFLELAEPLVRGYVMGDPTDAKTSLGPIAQKPHVAELEGFVGDARSRGGRLIAGGHATSVEGKGRFFEATLLADGDPSMELFRRESFGPIVAVMPVGSDEEALEKMNDSTLGLTASIWTTDRERADRLARDLQCGTVFMNRCDYLDPALPWSGWKDSGRGVSLSALGFEGLTRPKAIHFRLG